MRATDMTLIAGPCVIEDEGLVMEVAQELKRQTTGHAGESLFQIFIRQSQPYFNRRISRARDERRAQDPGRVREKTGLPLLTDFHTPEQAEPVAEIVRFHADAGVSLSADGYDRRGRRSSHPTRAEDSMSKKASFSRLGREEYRRESPRGREVEGRRKKARAANGSMHH